MGPQLETENRRSLRVWSPVLVSFVGALLASSTASCVIVTDDHDDDYYYDDYYVDPPPETPTTNDPALVQIDTGAEIPPEPGEGVGMFVEHIASADDGDLWRISTTCDTNYSGFACSFDAIIDAAGLRVFEELELEYDDLVQVGVDRAYFTPYTGFGVDGIVVRTDPNAILRLEMYLDGRSEPRFIYWVGGGVLHAGAPTNPIDFEPSGE